MKHGTTAPNMSARLPTPFSAALHPVLEKSKLFGKYAVHTLLVSALQDAGSTD
jgi:hypothetical protein